MSGKGKPVFVKRAPAYSSLHLLPISKLVPSVPIKVWATKTAEGWTGWLEHARKPGERATLMPKEWLKSSWKEVSEKTADKALADFKAGKASAANAAQAEPAKPGKGKAGKGAGAKPGVAKTAAVKQPEPEPPTGTDGPAKPETADAPAPIQAVTAADAVDIAVRALVQVGRALRAVPAQPVAPVAKVRIGLTSKPGLAKTDGKATTVKRRAARR